MHTNTAITTTAITNINAMRTASSAKQPIEAMAIVDAPDLRSFYNQIRDFSVAEVFDSALLDAAKVMASDVQELQSLVLNSGIPDFPIIFCRPPYALFGCVYLEGEANGYYVFLDAERCGSAERLRETYIHEIAHLISMGQDHDLSFAVLNNLFRAKADLEPTEVEFDYRACIGHGMTLQEAKQISIACASYARELGVDISLIGHLVRYSVDAVESADAPVEEIPARFREFASYE